jgi:SAM-dependent methyltransferase
MDVGTRASAGYTGEDGTYWAYQRPIGRLGGELDLWKFEPHIRTSDRVVDFGCGGGYLLARLPGTEKVGVEPSPHARAEARRQGVESVASLDDLPDAWADVVVSNHALEHTLAPHDELRAIRRVLKPGGRLVLVVPVDDWRSQRRLDPDDRDHHLYTWTPLLLGSLLVEAGLEPLSVRIRTRAWHPRVTPRVPSLLRAPVDSLIAVLLRRREIHALAVRRDVLPGYTADLVRKPP